MRNFSENRVALISGAASGIGSATAANLAQAGIFVAMMDRDAGALSTIAQQIRSHKGEVLEIVGDLIDPKTAAESVSQVKGKWGRLDIMVANAGVNGVWAPLEEIGAEEWDQTQDINVRGTFLTIRESLPLLKVNGGSIVVVASVNGTRIFSNTGATPYSCSKAAQVAMTKMLAVELGPSRIRVNVVCPGAISTRIEDSTRKRNLEDIKIPVEYPHGAIPLTGSQPGTPDDVAQLIGFLVSNAARHITGSEIYIDGGQSLLQG